MLTLPGLMVCNQTTQCVRATTPTYVNGLFQRPFNGYVRRRSLFLIEPVKVITSLISEHLYKVKIKHTI